jgi:hypothetical protein
MMFRSLLLMILCIGCGTSKSPDSNRIDREPRLVLSDVSIKDLPNNSKSVNWKDKFGNKHRAIVSTIWMASVNREQEMLLLKEYASTAMKEGLQVELKESGNLNSTFRYYRFFSTMRDERNSEATTYVFFGRKVIEVIFSHPGQNVPNTGQLAIFDILDRF